jgi:Ca-activated chloride channel family protein
MSFADPYLLLLLLALPVVLLLKARTGEASGAAGFSNVALLASFKPTWRMRYRWLPTFLRAGAIALLIIALARPQVGRANSELPGQGIDIALVMDTSSSMNSSLGNDTRMAVAQRVIGDFIKGRKDDRLGLVVFRASALVLSPLTLDYEALGEIIPTTGDIRLPDGTAIGVGLSNGLDLLRESRARSRVVILLTDGENNEGDIEPLEAARIAETLGIRVYTIGVLEEGARSGGAVNVDEEALRQIAEITGGRYFPAESESALEQIYASIENLEKSRLERPQFASYNEYAAYFLAAAVALLALEVTLRGTIWRTAT